MLTFGSLFAGIGGFDLGFERAGMVCKWQVEINDYAKKVLQKHWPDVSRWDDVRTFPPEGDWNVDVICGGFPCQDISYAGRGAGLAGERSGLFFEAVRVVQQLGPRFFVLENVAALLTRGLDVVLGTLAEIGYDAEWDCIPAAAVGAPHIRDRVFLLAYPGCDSAGSTEAIQRQEAERIKRGVDAGGGCRNVPDASKPGLPLSKQEVLRGAGRGQEGGAIAECGWWATEPDVGRVAYGIPSRVDRIRGIGNAVVPQVAEWIGQRIVEADSKITQEQMP